MMQKPVNTLNDICAVIITDSIPCWPLFSFRIFSFPIDLTVLKLIVVDAVVFLSSLMAPLLWVIVNAFGIWVSKVILILIPFLGIKEFPILAFCRINPFDESML